MRLSAVMTVLAACSVLALAAARAPSECEVSLALVDSATGRELPGLVRIRRVDGGLVKPAELLPRGLGLAEPRLASYGGSIHDWCVLPARTTVRLPREKIVIEAFSGLETEQATLRLDLAANDSADATIPLVRFESMASRGMRSANTHLHLMKISRDEADRYLLEVPRADGLDMLFVSYLERAGANQDYISNEYTAADLAALERRSGVIFGNGEEHRHNFTGFGEGYGHVMLLNIRDLIQPVSIGPGIAKEGTDGLPLQRGIDAARNDGATIVWCHNEWGREALPNFLTGRVHAQNIFDGSINSSYKDSFYRYLNAGLRVPFSTGTDWFQYDFSRVYVNVAGDPTVETWLKSLAEGKSFITNGPFLEFRVSGKTAGETVSLAERGAVEIEARARGRVDFEQIEVVQNGEVIYSAPSRRVGGHYEAGISVRREIDAPCWLALRTPPPPVERDPELRAPAGKNEFDRWVYAHTSAVHVNVAGQSRFDRQVAQQLLQEMQADRDEIGRIGLFADDQERARVLDVYTDGIRALEQRLSAPR